MGHGRYHSLLIRVSLSDQRIQLKVFRAGERIIDRIDFEELALKTVDPALGPKLTQWTSKKLDDEPPRASHPPQNIIWD